VLDDYWRDILTWTAYTWDQVAPKTERFYYDVLEGSD